MSGPYVSVIIPAYNEAQYLRDSVGSVLSQTYQRLEVVVVDDGSQDDTPRAVREFRDDRVVYVRHTANRMLAAARNTGCKVASGDLIAFLDADDYFHPEKIACHVAFLGEHPDVGVSYNARFELNHSETTVRELSRPPRCCGLADLVMGFPFAPSDMVVRRDWIERVGLFDERLTDFSEDLDINCRLALIGCRFAGISRALNYRRYHSGRRLKVTERLTAAIGVLEAVFSNPECPEELLACRNQALAAHSLVWACFALDQNDSDTGRRLLRTALTLNPSYLEGRPSKLMRELLEHCIADESRDHGDVLARILAQLPPELKDVSWDRDSLVAEGYLRRGARAALWGRQDDARRHLARAADLKGILDQRLVSLITWQLLGLEGDCGSKAAWTALSNLCEQLEMTLGPKAVRLLKSCYSANVAFHNDRAARYDDVLPHVWTAIRNRPRYVADRGVLAVSLRSLVPRLRPPRGTTDA